MGRILVSPDHLIEVASFFSKKRTELDQILNQLDKQMYFLEGGWSGVTRERFFQDYQIARQLMKVTLDRISSVGQELSFIARNFSQADESLNGALVLNVPGSGVPIPQGQLFKDLQNAGLAVLNGLKTVNGLTDEFFDGVTTSAIENATLGIAQVPDTKTDHPIARKLGEFVGDGVTTLVGAAETVGSAGLAGLSLAADGTVVLAPAGIMAGAIAAAGAAHGSTMLVRSAQNMGSNASDLVQMIKSGGKPSKETITSNTGKEIDVTPSSNHISTTDNPHPAKGEPNSSVDILDKNTGEIKTRRYYDENGRATRDVDFTNHGNPKQHPEWPHEHTFEWTEDGKFKRK
ncbi:WXG100 family type VII secretion target [Paenibacillus sp. P96]|uniref:WXG100 family type VII secretion target n=1 Tax=Paenibacillus zeirhizosphaerae TaxID=2987519 RepID=A0ABT9FVY5_9BACL|nr:WXG100 family type VII secretion target [Paenibacillus sp. P96]MDP4098780.1 WXG100 family type VII secretion target [Paenibacillus sp. P96]